MRPILAAIALICLASTTLAQNKCVSGKKTLYTDQPCPSDSAPAITGGTVSTIGTNTKTEALNREFLARRAAEEQQYNARIAQEYVQQVAADRTQCMGLESQAKSLEAAMRQPMDYSLQDQYRRQHRAIRDQQYRMKC